MKQNSRLSRRASMKSMGALGAAAFLGAHTASGAPSSISAAPEDYAASDVKEQIAEKVRNTSFVDTHEHLFEENVRLAPKTMPMIQCNDWALLVAGYLYSDLVSAGLPVSADTPWVKHDLFSAEVDPMKKWSLVEPYWPAVKNTGYGLAFRLSLRELYGVDDLSSDTELGSTAC